MICERCWKEFETLNHGHCSKCWEELLVFMRLNIEQLDADVAAHENDEEEGEEQ